MSKNNLILRKCAEFEKLANAMTIKACRSGYDFNFSPATYGSLGPGFYFTTNPDRAKKYAGPDGCIVWVEIHLSKPLVGPKKTIATQLGLENHIDEDTGAYDNSVGQKLGELAKKQGYDGIVAGESNGKTFEILVFDKSSIKPISKENII